MVLEISLYSQENTCDGVSFLRPAAFLKETLAQVFSCEFCYIFKNTFFHRTTPVAASENKTLIRGESYQSKLSKIRTFHSQNNRNIHLKEIDYEGGLMIINIARAIPCSLMVINACNINLSGVSDNECPLTS